MPSAGLGYGYQNQKFYPQPLPQQPIPAGLGYDYIKPNLDPLNTPPAGIDYYKESNFYVPPPLRNESSSQQAKLSNRAPMGGSSDRTGIDPITNAATGVSGYYLRQNQAAPSRFAPPPEENYGLQSPVLQPSPQNVTAERPRTINNYYQGTNRYSLYYCNQYIDEIANGLPVTEMPPSYSGVDYYDDDEHEPYDDDLYAPEKEEKNKTEQELEIERMHDDSDQIMSHVEKET